MTETSPEAQALIDRLARVDPANPRHDKAAIERAINAHLATLGLPTRPFAWADDVKAGFAAVISRADHPSGAYDPAWRATRDAASQAVWDAAKNAPWREAWEALWAVRDDAMSTWELAGRAAWCAGYHSTWGGAWHAAWPAGRAARDAAREAAKEAPWGHVWAAADAARDVEEDKDPWLDAIIAKERDAMGENAWDIAREAALDAAWDSAWCTVWGASCLAPWEAENGVKLIKGVAAIRHPTTAKLAEIKHSMVEAFESGLFYCWIMPHDVVCVLQPSLSVESGRLHRSDGPAVRWRSGEAYYYWHGRQVPAWIIEERHKTTVATIRSELNQELRRCMVEIYGLSRYLRDAGARLVHQDAFGKLWEAQVGHDTWRIVEVENGTLEPDGSRRTYTLDVTDAAAFLGWPIKTARAAVAATYGLRAKEYKPTIRT